MKKYRVIFEVFSGGSSPEIKSVEVEAGNKKLALARGMMEINKLPGYSDLFKKVRNIEEVK